MSLRARVVWVSVVLLLGALLALPSFFSAEQQAENAFIPDGGINLGLDLQGGIHWLLRIDSPTRVRQEMDQIGRSIQGFLSDEQLPAAELQINAENQLELRADPATLARVRGYLDDENLDIEDRGESLLIEVSSVRYKQIISLGVAQALDVLRRRIDSLGVSEPVIAPQGDERILVQMPGNVNPAQAASILAKTTFLEFKIVEDAAANEALLGDRYPGGLPEDREIVVVRNADGGVSEALLVPGRAELTGSMLVDSRLSFDRRNRPIVTFEWDSEGTRIFREFTGNHIGDRLAAIIDGEVVTAPVIQSRIGRRGQIEGNFTQQEAADLSVRLRSGALPVPLEIEEERAVGPALGRDSIERGIMSILVAGLVVVLFMILYYRTAGVLANLVLGLNLVLILGVMGLVQATLTLPGMAGLVLTVGMAVDANVIIFERIREELRGGKSSRNAIQIGFKRSRLTILDANVTTLLTALVLFQFGSGPIKGFAVTLSVGILSSVFCALVVTRLLIDLMSERGIQAVKI
ncbi:MAG: protein translocase subunit SecD [Myxococcales bacterium]|nr:protein translocase subunit SecD [Myxococcales bacterium]